MTPGMKKAVLNTWTPELIFELVEELTDEAVTFGIDLESPLAEDRFQLASEKLHNVLSLILNDAYNRSHP